MLRAKSFKDFIVSSAYVRLHNSENCVTLICRWRLPESDQSATVYCFMTTAQKVNNLGLTRLDNLEPQMIWGLPLLCAVENSLSSEVHPNTEFLPFCADTQNVCARKWFIYINIYLLLGSLHYWRPPQRQDAPPKTLGWAGLNPQEDNMTVLDAKMAARAARGWSFLSKWSNVRADLRVTAIFDSILIRSGRDCARQWGWLGQSGRIKERNRTWRFGDDIINIIHQLFQFKTSTGK